MSNKCMREGCDNAAKWQVGMRIWSIATAPSNRTNNNCLNMMTSLLVCDEHKPEVTKEFMLTDHGRRLINEALRVRGKTLPDYSSAEVLFKEIIGKPLDVTKPPG